MQAPPQEPEHSFIDIGANLTDDMFEGRYNGKAAHESDWEDVLTRAWSIGMKRIIITAGNYEEAQKAIALARKDGLKTKLSLKERLFCTVGVHPTRCGEFDKAEEGAEQYLNNLLALIEANRDKVVAVGEFDYDRLNFCDKETQKKCFYLLLEYFEQQFELAERSGLPLFLHMRAACDDFCDIVSKNRPRFKHGVVHSFTDSAEDLQKVLALDLFIGLNGCSLKTEENLAVAAAIPLNRLMLETDAPWCDIRNTHAGAKHIKTQFQKKDKKKFEKGKWVKGRNEPAAIVQVLEVVAAVKGIPTNEVSRQVFENTAQVFFSSGQQV
ncbi:Deoxyribonuclease TATDN1 [Balamuthia mandrillaris]